MTEEDLLELMESNMLEAERQIEVKLGLLDAKPIEDYVPEWFPTKTKNKVTGDYTNLRAEHPTRQLVAVVYRRQRGWAFTSFSPMVGGRRLQQYSSAQNVTYLTVEEAKFEAWDALLDLESQISWD